MEIELHTKKEMHVSIDILTFWDAEMFRPHWQKKYLSPPPSSSACERESKVAKSKKKCCDFSYIPSFKPHFFLFWKVGRGVVLGAQLLPQYSSKCNELDFNFNFDKARIY